MVTLTLSDAQAAAIARDFYGGRRPVAEVVQEWLSGLADQRIRAQAKAITPIVSEALAAAGPDPRKTALDALGLVEKDGVITRSDEEPVVDGSDALGG